MKVSKEQIQQYKNQRLIDFVTKMCLASSVLTLNKEFGFGSDRLNKFASCFEKTMADHVNTYDEVAYEALTQHVKDCGININFD